MQNIVPGDVVTFTEYEQSPLSGIRHVRERLENMLVEAVIKPGEVLSRDRIEHYYGSDLDDIEYRVLSVSQATRLMLQDDDGQIYCVSVVDGFLKTGMQTIEFGVRAMPEATGAPSYLQFLSAFGGGQEVGG